MTDSIKLSTLQNPELFKSVEAISPFPRINPKDPRPDGYQRHATDSEKERKKQDPRRFLKLRSLIRTLQVSGKINKVDLATADAEMRSMGLTVVEEKLIEDLLHLKIPLVKIEQLVQQIGSNSVNARQARERRIDSQGSELFPVSTEGLSEYNLVLDEMTISPGQFNYKIVDEINQGGLCVKQKNRLRLTFSRAGSVSGVAKEMLTLQISVLLGVVESDEADRRAILYPQTDKSYGLYADKRISLSI